MEIMDRFAYELLSQPLPPGVVDPFSGSSGGYDGYGATDDMEQLDNYFRAIGVLPPLPPANNSHVQPAPPASSYDDDDGNAAAALAAYDSDDDDDDIGASLRAMETDARQRPSPVCTDPVARAALVPWMHDLARHFGVGQDALHRAVSYADRFLSARADIVDDDYQLRLLGAAAVYAASKYEDSGTAPRLMNARDIAACCGFAASREVLDAERALLAALGYRLGGPTAHTFVEHFTRRRGVGGQEVRRRAHAIADSSLLDHRCLKLLPSAVAAAAILLAAMCLEPAHDREQVRRWSRELTGLTGYKPLDVYDGLDCLYNMLPDDPGFDMSPLLFADPIPN